MYLLSRLTVLIFLAYLPCLSIFLYRQLFFSFIILLSRVEGNSITALGTYVKHYYYNQNIQFHM